jgi:hypothetical protein
MRNAMLGLAFLLAITAVAAGSLLRPYYSWDMLAYSAAVLAFEEHGAEQVHAQTYALTQAAIPPAAYSKLVTGETREDRAYRQDVARNAHDFMAQLPFYRIRPLYIAAVYIVTKTGLDLPHALVAVSVLGYVAIALLLWAWLRRHLPPHFALLLSALLALSPILIDVARATAPDALSAALILGALYALLEHRAPGVFALMMLLAICARTDNVILALLLLAYLGIYGRGRVALSPPLFVLFGVAIAASYFGINALAGNYGWAALFHHTFIGFTTHPDTMRASVSLATYAQAVFRGVRSVFNSSILIFAALGLIAYALPTEGNRRLARYNHVLLIIAATVLIRYALFPIFWDRLLVPYYLAVTIILIAKATDYVRVARASVRAARLTPDLTPKGEGASP